MCALVILAVLFFGLMTPMGVGTVQVDSEAARPAPTLMEDGITRDRARGLALEWAGDAEGPAIVVWAESGQLARFADPGALPGEPRDRRVWAVQLEGRFPGECVIGASGESACPPSAHGKLVVLDFQTGEFILSESR